MYSVVCGVFELVGEGPVRPGKISSRYVTSPVTRIRPVDLSQRRAARALLSKPTKIMRLAVGTSFEEEDWM